MRSVSAGSCVSRCSSRECTIVARDPSPAVAPEVEPLHDALTGFAVVASRAGGFRQIQNRTTSGASSFAQRECTHERPPDGQFGSYVVFLQIA
jgi:hypothetical protein